MQAEPQAKPLIIGVTTRHGDPAWVQKNTHNYLNVLAEYGVASVLLAPDAPAVLPNGLTFQPDAQGRLPATVLDHLDGIIFSGGGDVDPKYFGQLLAGAEAESIDLQRDELELHLGQQALRTDIPIFGICRGCQVLNVAAGGGMVQHLDNHRSPADGTAFHTVALAPGSRLHQVIGQDALTVNTFHHQGVDQATLAPMFVPVGVAQPDPWLIEAYESPSHRWVIGVQWHPERVFELEAGHRRLWESFLAACAAYQATA
ncbi:MAG: gamma-glutamyl-gamma-aminobutyrate hydrolase family protein [Chloroflexi bacterium]|nr:gamma-glutamyl-gamma-aminobutyrate hydrolase family protein [Chloroflexota bacterium]